MLNGHIMHQLGFDGNKVHVAVIDGGFSDFLETPGLDSMILNYKLLGTKDFVEGDDYVFESSSHGRQVLSCMASNLPYFAWFSDILYTQITKT